MNKQKLIKIAAISALPIFLIGGVAFAQLNNSPSVTAEDVPPIAQQVEDHEQRIGALETTTAELGNQVNNTSNEVKANGERVTVVEKKVTVVEKAQAKQTGTTPEAEPEAPKPPKKPSHTASNYYSKNPVYIVTPVEGRSSSLVTLGCTYWVMEQTVYDDGSIDPISQARHTQIGAMEATYSKSNLKLNYWQCGLKQANFFQTFEENSRGMVE